MEEEKVYPEYLYKIVSTIEWQESLLKHYVVNSTIDEDFIHLAKEEQIEHVLKKFWHAKDYVIVKLNMKKLVGHLVYETNPGGSTKYYHLYEGKIPLDAVEGIKH